MLYLSISYIIYYICFYTGERNVVFNNLFSFAVGCLPSVYVTMLLNFRDDEYRFKEVMDNRGFWEFVRRIRDERPVVTHTFGNDNVAFVNFDAYRDETDLSYLPTIDKNQILLVKLDMDIKSQLEKHYSIVDAWTVSTVSNDWIVVKEQDTNQPFWMNKKFYYAAIILGLALPYKMFVNLRCRIQVFTFKKVLLS